MDSSKEWSTLSKSEKEKLQHQSAEDGEFWSVTVRHRKGLSGYSVASSTKEQIIATA